MVTTTAGIPTPAVACLLSRTPHVWWLHELMSPRFGSWFVLGDAFSQRAIGLLSRRVLTVSHTVETHYSRRIAAGKLRTVYLGIMTPPTPDSAVEPGALRLVSVGRLTSAKGSATAVRALAAVDGEHARITLRLVGPVTPEYRRVLEQLAHELGVRDRLELVDFTTDPHAQIEWGNVLLTCAIDEAFGRSTAEALKSGRPVIGVRSGGTQELVDDGVDGILFEPGDVAAAARAMEALAADPARLEAMGRAARARNHSRFEVADEVAGVAAVLAEATAGATRWRTDQRGIRKNSSRSARNQRSVSSWSPPSSSS